MARLFIRLKLTLLLNGFRRGWQQALGIVFATAYVVPMAIIAAFGTIALGREEVMEPLVEPLLVIGFVLVWVTWLVGPLLAFGMDETLDPSRLRSLPLRRHQLMTGLFAASSVGLGPLATLILMYGVSVGMSRGPASAALVVGSAVAQFALCVAGARALTTTLSRRLQSRRGRDVVTVGGGLFAVGVAVLTQVPRLFVGGASTDTSPAALAERLGTVASALSALPPAWAARAVTAGSTGNWGQGVLWLGAAAIAVAALLWWWAHALERGLDAPGSHAGAVDTADLYPRLLRWLPRDRLGAGIAKDIRYTWRVPQLRAQYLVLAVLVVPAAFYAAAASVEPFVVLLAPLAALLIGTAGFNLFGTDRGAVWLLEVSGPQPRSDIVAKSTVTMTLSMAIVAALAVVLGVLTQGWQYVVPSLLAGAGCTAVVGAVGMVVSVVAPYPLPDTPTNVFAANAGLGCAAVLLQSLGLFVELILLAPVAAGLALALRNDRPLLSVVALAAAVYGSLLWWLGTTIAARRLARRGPEFVAALQARAR
ncbi:MAG: hypothetical protein GEU74_09415 [Nitriliruptorales bacterium]|nr:hypothetical protein [Nitriliruptorales bacterium]